MTLASCIHKLEPYKIPQVVAQIPLPPINVPMPIRKALTVDDEDKVVNHLIHGEYELTKTSWSILQKKYSVTRGRIYSALKGKRMLWRFTVPTTEETCQKIRNHYINY